MNRRLDEFLEFGSRDWWILAVVLLSARAMDLLSTWIASPTLSLEANPVARRLGWRFGIPLNAGLSLLFAAWPMLAISLTTTSFLVASRNFQQAWIMRAMGEDEYRLWLAERLHSGSRALALGCFLMESLLTGLVGLALLVWSEGHLMSFAIGMGVVSYAAAVGLFTTLAWFRRR